MRAPATKKETSDDLATGSRKTRALATRRRMLEAAYRLFCEKGYISTTMGAIADEAAVAVQTLYFTFHTKGAILGEVLGAAILGFDNWQGPPREPVDASDPATLRIFHAWFASFEREPDAHRALSLFVDGGVDAMRTAGALAAAMQAAAGDPDASAVFELGEKRRAESFATVIRILSKKGGLRPGLTVARATDIALALFSGPMYHALAGRGWSHNQCRRFFVDALSQQLLSE